MKNDLEQEVEDLGEYRDVAGDLLSQERKNVRGKKNEGKEFAIKTVFATESPMMRTFDEKNLGKRPPPFAYTPSKNLGRRVFVDRA